MTDRYKGLVVTLSHPKREDDLKGLVNAILMFDGVVSVSTIVDNPSDHINRTMVKTEIAQKLWKALDE